MALPEEKPWVSLDQEAFLLLTHVAKGVENSYLSPAARQAQSRGARISAVSNKWHRGTDPSLHNLDPDK